MRVDLFRQDVCRVWLRCWPADGFDMAGEDEIGSMPMWLSCLVEDIGWDHVLDVPWQFLDDGNGWPTFRWLAKNGIAPDQPFLIEVGGYTTTRSYEGEWDAEWHADLIAIEKWPHDRVIKSLIEAGAIEIGLENK